jgi:hypothetical protein
MADHYFSTLVPWMFWVRIPVRSPAVTAKGFSSIFLSAPADKYQDRAMITSLPYESLIH